MGLIVDIEKPKDPDRVGQRISKNLEKAIGTKLYKALEKGGVKRMRIHICKFPGCLRLTRQRYCKRCQRILTTPPENEKSVLKEYEKRYAKIGR